MKFFVTTLLALVLLSAATKSLAQEAMTVEQLLSAGESEERAFAAVMYIMGWKEGAGIQLTRGVQDWRENTGPTGQEYAARLQALGECLMRLGVADLAAGLNASIRDNTTEPETPARSALRDVAEDVCQGAITQEPLPQPANENAQYLEGRNQPWSIAIDSCMQAGGSRSDCIASLPRDLLAELEAWEAENGQMRRSQMRQRSRYAELEECPFGVQCL